MLSAKRTYLSAPHNEYIYYYIFKNVILQRKHIATIIIFGYILMKLPSRKVLFMWLLS